MDTMIPMTMEEFRNEKLIEDEIGLWLAGQCIMYRKEEPFILAGDLSITDFDIELNADGLSWINKGGMTKFMLQSNRDINGNAPTGYEIIEIHSSDKGTIYKPILTINYKFPFGKISIKR